MAKVKIPELLEAHVAFEVARFDDVTLRATMHEELGAFYDWMSEVPVREVLPRRGTLSLLQGRLLNLEFTDDSREFLEILIKKTGVLLRNTHQPARELVPESARERLIESLGEAVELRQQLVRDLVQNPIFTRIISEILFDGIKTFALENNLAKNLPGAQALLALGQNLVSGVAPGLEEKFESNIKAFIATHSGEILKNSEQIILRSMKPEVLREAILSGWNESADRSLADLVRLIPENEAAAVKVAEDLWDMLRRPLLENLLTLWLDLFLNRYGYRPASFLLDQAGIDRDTFIYEGDTGLSQVVRRAREDGYIEERIRARLTAFYESDAAAAILK